MSQPEASPELQKGMFLVIEGSDGSGKSTQYKLLLERLKSVGHDVKEIKFPRYEEEASYFVRKYLKGGYCGAGAAPVCRNWQYLPIHPSSG